MIYSKKVLIFGGSGLLGSTLQRQFPPKSVIKPTHKELDLLNTVDVLKFIEKKQPTTIIYAAGITKIDEAEKNSLLAFRLNYHIPEIIACHASKMSISLIYISTDAVFDGYANKYRFLETDIPKALSVYGKSKLRGEEAILTTSAKNSVIRLIKLFSSMVAKRLIIRETSQ